MSTRWVWRVWVAAVAAAGCAGTSRSSAVPVEPISAGRPSELSRYDVAFSDDGGGPGARVFLGAGEAIERSRQQTLVHVGLRIENLEREHALRAPTGQLFLSQLGAQPIAPVEIDGAVVPDALEVPPGEARSFDVAFTLPSGIRVDDVRAFALNWALERSDGVRTAHATEFASVERGRVYGPPLDQQGRPASTAQLSSPPRTGSQLGRGRDLPPESTRMRQGKAQFLPSRGM